MASNVTAELNANEKEIFYKFKKTVGDMMPPEHTDHFLLKCLRSKNFDLEECLFTYTQNVKCHAILRHDMEKDWSTNEVVDKFEFQNFIGYAKDGSPVRYVHFGNGDFMGFIMSLDSLELFKFCAGIMIKDSKMLKAQSKKLEKMIHGVTYIIDMDKFSLRQVLHPQLVELAFDFFHLLQEYYPEIWNVILVINAPAYFHIAFAIFKPIFRKSLLSKIYVASKDKTADLLMNYIEKDILPVSIGGDLIDSKGDPSCSEYIKYGGRIPEEYYLQNSREMKFMEDGIKEACIRSRSCYNVAIPIETPKSMIRMEFQTEGGSIVMTILYREFNIKDSEIVTLPPESEYLDERKKRHNVEVLTPSIHFQSQLTPIDNTICAIYPGIYIFKFVNTNNWFSSKRLIYRFTVTSPK